jgi:hypothetical protein
LCDALELNLVYEMSRRTTLSKYNEKARQCTTS